jgi:hypothetical protein
MNKNKIFVLILLVLITIFCFFGVYKSYNIENMDNTENKKAFCLITREPNIFWLDFLNTFINNYDVFIMIDNNNFNCNEYKKKYPKMNLIQINDYECKENGYWDSSYIIKKELISWDKALYYFNHINTKYDYVWFCEDDVYIRDITLIQKMDIEYPNSDLLTETNDINTTGEIDSWIHWLKAKDTMKLPWCKSMICLCRLSKQLLNKIDKYTIEHKKLTFIEFLYNTIAYQNNMSISNPSELVNIHFDKKWDKNNIDKTKIYHPFKNVDDHLEMRNK